METQRFYPTPPQDTYRAIVGALTAKRCNVKSKDDFSLAVTFSTPVSGWSWGSTVMLSVIPSGDGSVVSLTSQKRFATNITANSSEARKIAEVLDAAGEALRRGRS